MAQWICAKCQQGASSKCVNERSVFTVKDLGNRVETLIMENFTDIRWPEDGSVEIKLFKVEDVAMLKERIALLAQQSEQRLVQLACHHEWLLNDGETCELGHTYHRRYTP